MKYNILYALCALAVLLNGCTRTKFQEQNIEQNELSLSHKGNVILSYNKDNYQIGYNPEHNIFRIHDDTMGKYFILTCSERPTSEGQSLKATLQYTTSDDIVTERNLIFEVQKTDNSGKIWLWNKSKKYGLVIKQL